MATAYSNGIVSRKGHVLLTRLGVTLPFESTIEEAFARILDFDSSVIAVQRAEPVNCFLSDGQPHVYTSDFLITFTDQTSIVVDCKPYELLRAILQEESEKWQIRADLFRRKGTPLYIVTDRDLPEALKEQAIAFGPFYHVATDVKILSKTHEFLKKQSALPLSVLREQVRVLAQCSYPDLDATLYAMIAQHQLISDITKPPPDCQIDLPARKIPAFKSPVGTLVLSLLASLDTSKLNPISSKLQTSTDYGLEIRFLKTERGRKYFSLFALYSDPTRILSNSLAAEIGGKVGLSARGVFRFRADLIEAGAPGITFTQLVPYLFSDSKKQGVKRVESKVQVIIEQKALEHYFIPTSKAGRARTISDLYEIVRAECREQGIESPPAYTTIKRHIENIIARDPIKATQMRDGREAADKLKARQGTLNVVRYGEVLGIDCTPCDIFTTKTGLQVRVKSKRDKANSTVAEKQYTQKPRRGNFVTVTDSATGQVLSSTLFEGSIGAREILLVLQAVFLGDCSDMLAAGVKVVPQGKGLPFKIRMDQGTEFQNKQLRRVLTQFGIELLPRNKFSKHFGGLEESTIKTLSFSHHVLPGTSMNSIDARADSNPVREAFFTIDDLNRYHQRVMESHNQLCAPLQLFTRHQHAQHLIDTGLSSWRPPSESQLDYLKTRMQPETEPTAQKSGLRQNGLTYKSPLLDEFIIHEEKMVLIVNPDDVSEGKAVHPKLKEPITVYSHPPDRLDKPVTLKIWKAYKIAFNKAKRRAKDSVKTVHQIANEVIAEINARFANERRALKSAKKKSKAEAASVMSGSTIKPSKLESDVFPVTPKKL